MNNLVSSIMQQNVIVVGVEDSIEKVERIFRIHKQSFAAVKDEEGDFFGIISSSNLFRFQMAWKNIGALSAREICSESVSAVSPSVDLKYAAELMLKKQSEYLVVMENGEVLGVIPPLSLLKAAMLKLNPNNATSVDEKAFFVRSFL